MATEETKLGRRRRGLRILGGILLLLGVGMVLSVLPGLGGSFESETVLGFPAPPPWPLVEYVLLTLFYFVCGFGLLLLLGWARTLFIAVVSVYLLALATGFAFSLVLVLRGLFEGWPRDALIAESIWLGLLAFSLLLLGALFRFVFRAQTMGHSSGADGPGRDQGALPSTATAGHGDHPEENAP